MSADNVEFLVEKKLRPIGVLARADGSNPKLKKADPMLALKFRTGLVPERAVNFITTLFYPLFFPPVVIAVLAGLVALDVWLFFVHGVAQSVRDLLYQPVLFLMVFGLVVLSAAFHECGHATACRYGGAKPGVLGVGIYLVWPAFFSDVTDVYRLGKVGRIRTDLGGIYFNIIFSLLTAGAYFLTGFEPLLAVILLQHFEILHQLLPFLRLDGYYIISDLTGVPDLFARIKPILRSLIPWREGGERVNELKPWVRVVVTLWVLATIPALLYLLGILAISAPRMFATAWDSFFVQFDKVSAAFGNDEPAAGLASSIQIASLLLPLMGMVVTFGRFGKRLGVAAWSKTSGQPALRGGLVSTILATVGLLVFLWWPNGEYKPIQPGERGTIQDSISLIRYVPTGRPALTPEREAELNGAPMLREQPGSPTNTDVNEPDLTPDEPAPGGIPVDASQPQELEPGDPQPDEEQSPLGEQTAEAQPGTREQKEQSTPEGTAQNEVQSAQPSSQQRLGEQTIVEPVTGTPADGAVPGTPVPGGAVP